MPQSTTFYGAILDSVPDHITVIDQAGGMRYVNAAWVNFGIENTGQAGTKADWEGVNYLDVCDASAVQGDEHAKIVAIGIRDIIEAGSGAFYHEYPCHSDTEKRWFILRVMQLRWGGDPWFIISHHNITERKLMEEKLHAQSVVDALTGLANRRRFDEFLRQEWRRGARLRKPLSLILLDIDHFKLFNDRYGHLAGDVCLKNIGGVIQGFARRPGDIAARFGGEEFAIVLGDTGAVWAETVAHGVLRAIAALSIAHDRSRTSGIVTASAGVATVTPEAPMREENLIASADEMLYNAKKRGRHRVCAAGPARAPIDAVATG